jgi:hypothetical protein
MKLCAVASTDFEERKFLLYTFAFFITFPHRKISAIVTVDTSVRTVQVSTGIKMR